MVSDQTKQYLLDGEDDVPKFEFINVFVCLSQMIFVIFLYTKEIYNIKGKMPSQYDGQYQEVAIKITLF